MNAMSRNPSAPSYFCTFGQCHFYAWVNTGGKITVTTYHGDFVAICDSEEEAEDEAHAHVS